MKYAGESFEGVIKEFLHGRFHPLSYSGQRFQEEGESGEGCSSLIG